MSKVLDGTNFSNLPEHLAALGDYGLYVEPRSSQWTELLRSVTTEFDPGKPLMDQVKVLIDQELGLEMERSARKQAKTQMTRLPDYVEELKQDVEEGRYGKLEFISPDEPLRGVIDVDGYGWWWGETKIDPLCLETDFDAIFGGHLDPAAVEVFKAAFEAYRSSDYMDFYGPDDNLDTGFRFQNSDFADEFMSDYQPLEELNALVRDAICKAFTRFVAVQFTSDKCFFVINKNDYFAALGGVRNETTLELCFFRGRN